MRTKTLVLFAFCLCTNSLFAQKIFSIKGVASDSVANVKLVNTSVAVLNAKDSILLVFTRAGQNGAFALKNLSKGNFILLVSYPGYADYVEHFSLDSLKSTYDFGTINMKLKSRILRDVIIKGTAVAIKIKGDTTEFNAAAYKVQPNAKVEDLLKQLPGIEVDKDGKIKAQGQAVNKVLVDGEEFFGDDPTLVTKNIRADMVDKVQLYDKKSDQAAFTGIDDGKKEKTLNIKLKEDKKNGSFGKVEAAAATEGYYEGQVLFNAFKKKQKFSVYGITSNNGKVGLGWDDNQKYGAGDALQYGDDGSVYFNSGGGEDLDSFSGQYNGKGIPLARTGGVHYDDKWKDDKESININYKIGSINVDGTSETLTQNNLPDTVFNTRSDQTFHNYMFRQKLAVVYQVKLDTSSDLKISVDGIQKHSETRNNTIGSTMRNDTLVNTSTTNLINTVNQGAFNASGFYTKKFKKPGRTFSLNISEAYSQSAAKGFLNDEVDFYNAQKVRDSVQKTDQYKTTDLLSNVIRANATWSEPFSKVFAIVVNYGIGIDNSSADRKTFDPSTPGNYNLFVDTFSSNFKLTQLSNQAGAIFNYKKGKSVFNFGTRVSDVNFKQVDELSNSETDRRFINWAPQARYQYNFSQYRGFSINYDGKTNQPTLDQLQPLRSNNDPLNIIVGNPDLKPSFTNNFQIGYNSYKVITSQYFYVFGSYSFTSNPIVTDVTTNIANGKNTSQSINLSGKTVSNFSLNTSFQRKLEKSGINLAVELNTYGNLYYSFANDVLTSTKRYVYSPRLSVSKYTEKKLSFYFTAGPDYVFSQSSLQPALNNNGWGVSQFGQFSINLPLKFQVGMDDNYEYTGATASFNHDFSRFLLNAFVEKKVLKGENLKFRISGNDLLNQNRGFDRSANGNQISQNSYTAIKRYFMCTITYDFSKMAGVAPKK